MAHLCNKANVFDLRHIVCGGALKHYHHVRRNAVRRRVHSAKADFLLHGEHAVKIAFVIVCQKLHQHCAAHAVVQRLAHNALFAKALEFGGKAYPVARLNVFQGVVLILCANVNKKLAVAKHGFAVRGGLKMNGLCAYNAFYHFVAHKHAL